MQRHPDYTRNRIKALVARLKELVYPDRRPLTSLEVSGPHDRISYVEAQKLTGFRPAAVGERFGPLWATFWFRGAMAVPKEWAGRRLDLVWEFRGENTLWMNGKSVQGLNHDPTNYEGQTRPDATLTPKARAGETLRFQLEAACNNLFGTFSPRDFWLENAYVSPFDDLAWELHFDLLVLHDLERDSTDPKRADLDKAWAGKLLSELNRFANAFVEEDRATWKPAQKILKGLYQTHTAGHVHEMSAIGHAHIDTAWLWPLAETHRKCERTFSTATRYMDEYPEYKFACSQAYQYEVIRQRNPDLFARIKAAAKRGQWVPVGGTWIEPDCNLPSGESLCRQFVTGQRFFEQHFGRRCAEFWNPDVFGYNGQLPQICNLAGIKRFLTQKLSWNYFNKPHHHTFVWEGIDGSELFTHFPPADTYNANASVQQVRDNARNYKDHDRSNDSYYLFGYGDGGGGPTKAMLELLRREKDLQGLPRTTIRSSDEFFTKLEASTTDRPRMVGELYFELHRGTYTSQAATKRGNRKGEILLHDAELLATLASETADYVYPAGELDRLWKLLLLNQFHDIIPGSSITLVYEDAARDYAEIEAGALTIIDAAIAALGEAAPSRGSKAASAGKRATSRPPKSDERLADDGSDQPWGAGDEVPFNTTAFARTEVVARPDGSLAVAACEGYSAGTYVKPTDEVKVAKVGAGYVLENAVLRATLAADGRVTSLIHKPTARETIAPGKADTTGKVSAVAGNTLLLHEDRPVMWEAWDVEPQHLEKYETLVGTHARVVTREKLRGEVAFDYAFGASKLTVTVRLDAHARRLEFHVVADWRESRKFLKAEFPVAVRAMNATYEMQFGTVERPTHYNTMYDLARFEVPGHRFADLSEPGFGVTLLSESKYGYSTFGNVMRLSLLRSPKDPDPTADMGTHRFAYALMPHEADHRAAGSVAEGLAFNLPLRHVPAGALPRGPLFSVSSPDLVLDTVKRADTTDGVLLRLYETHGTRGTATLTSVLPFKKARLVNLLEDRLDAGELKVKGETIELPYRPFQVLSVLLT